MKAVYQYAGPAFIFAVHPDKVSIKRKAGLDETEWCAICGKPIEQLSARRHRRYCSNKCRKRDSRKKAGLTNRKKNTRELVEPSYLEELTLPLMDIQAISGENSILSLEIWTGLTTGQSFYVGNKDELMALMKAIGEASERLNLGKVEV